MKTISDQIDELELVPPDLQKFKSRIIDDIAFAFGGVLSDGSYVLDGRLEWASLEAQLSYINALHQKYRELG
jgi:hypothetical protein